MNKKFKLIGIISMISLLLMSCNSKAKMEKYKHTFLHTFDTLIDITVYSESEEQAKEYFEYAENRFEELHEKYDKYKNYDGVNNIKTINDNAGIEPVVVDEEVFNVIEDSIKWYHEYSDKTDISMGALIDVWTKYRDLNSNPDAKDLPDSERLPSVAELEEAASHIGIEHIIIDRENMTVYIDDENVQMDVGAVAKGYAVEIVADELVEKGMESGIINAGGNVRTIGAPSDGQRAKWGIGIDAPMDTETLIGWSKDPEAIRIPETEVEFTEVVFVNDMSVVTSGDYQRYFVVGDRLYHHLIDKSTMYPGDNYRLASVITEDSGLADFLSTAVFLSSYEEGRELVDSIDGVEAIWLMKDGEKLHTAGMESIMRSTGATGAK